MRDIQVGDHVVGRPTLRLTGRVQDMFRAEWRPSKREGCRVLVRHDTTATDVWPLMCRIKLIRPYSIADRIDDVPPGVHPIISDEETGMVEEAYVPINFLQPIPDGL